MTEEDTFKTLKRTPLPEMFELMENRQKEGYPYPMQSLGNSMAVEVPRSYLSMNRYVANARLLKEHGWEVEDYMTEMERKTVLEYIRTFNSAIVFPPEILEHAREYFPNLKFTQAKIELE